MRLGAYTNGDPYGDMAAKHLHSVELDIALAMSATTGIIDLDSERSQRGAAALIGIDKKYGFDPALKLKNQ